MKEKSARDRAAEAQAEEQKAAEHRREMAERVKDMVMRQIVPPVCFHKANGHHLFDDRYRVNVLVAHDSEYGYGKELMIERSYFVVSNGLEIIRSDPLLPSHRGQC